MDITPTAVMEIEVAVAVAVEIEVAVAVEDTEEAVAVGAVEDVILVIGSITVLPPEALILKRPC